MIYLHQNELASFTGEGDVNYFCTNQN